MRSLWLLSLLIGSYCAQAQTVELDNSWVRGTRISVAPHAKLRMHPYPATVVIYLSSAHERITEPAVPPREVTHKSGDAAYLNPGTRGEENLSDAPIEKVFVELKPDAPALPLHPVTLDPTKLDPKHHMIEFENNRVRIVLEPHVKGPMHEHSSYLIVYVTDLHTTVTQSDGKLTDNIHKRGEVTWRDFARHATENVGDQKAMEIQVELK
jgi:hypothetical protein